MSFIEAVTQREKDYRTKQTVYAEMGGLGEEYEHRVCKCNYEGLWPFIFVAAFLLE